MSKRRKCRLGRFGIMQGATALAVLGFVAAPAAGRGNKGLAARVAELERRLDVAERALERRPPDISTFTLPERIELCDEPVDLRRPDVRERVEREFYLMVGNRAQVVLWLRRARRVFPVVDAAVARVGACPDLKYLAVIESGLRPGVVSSASARGWWQFMAGTARAYGLAVDAVIDERADLEKSTRAGVKYLAELYERFDSWALAAAAYNTGPTRLARAIDAQGPRDYWRLKLVPEAERYVPRIVAAKLILDDPSRYGFHVNADDGYPPETVGYVKVQLDRRRPFDLLDAARGMSVDYRTLWRLNPQLTDETFESDRAIVIRVPPGTEPALRRWLRANHANKPGIAKSGTTRAARLRKETYTVRAGDSLGTIAERHAVSVEDLTRWNRIRDADVVYPGQQLEIWR